MWSDFHLLTLLFVLKTLFFRAILGSQWNWEESTEISHIFPVPHIQSLPHYGRALPEWCICYSWWAYPDTASSSPEVPSVQSELIPGVPHRVGVDKCVMACLHHYNIAQSIFTAVKIWAPPIHPSSFPDPWQLLIFLNISTVWPFPECHIVEIIQYSAFLDGLLSLTDMHLSILLSLQGLVAHLFSAPSSIPLSGWTTVYLSLTYCLKDVLVASKFGQVCE